MTHRRPIYAAFVLSGVAGLVYEVLWSRYLGLYVGHAAFAQVLVLAVYLGGMAVGAMSVARLSKSLPDPLLYYAAAEGVLGLFGLAFHFVFVAATNVSYDVLFPALGSASLVGALRWGIAGLLVLPQAVLLGTTFPFMAAGIVRSDRAHPGRSVALVYLLNTLGGAAGVLLAGFVFVGWLGLAGTSVAAALMNLVAAGTVVMLRPQATRGEMRGEGPDPERTPDGIDDSGGGATAPDGSGPLPASSGPWAGKPERLRTVLFSVAFGTALASFAYEIGWIRMLSLVLGSATHSFELMLSAFILGLALGAWVIRDRTDRSTDPVRLLGGVQVLMGLAALISIPLYVLCFDLMASLVTTLPGKALGYELFNISRYGLCLLVMLPSTMLAGMTLPLITGSLLRAGLGESVIGGVYAVNTIGSVVGAGVAGLLLLPLLGLKGLIVAGAALDVGLGLWLLGRSVRLTVLRPLSLVVPVAMSVVVFAGVTYGTELNPTLLTSGVFRGGDLPTEERHLSLYFQQGRTATVSAHVGRADGVIVLATNGKPDASIGPRWIMEGRDTLPISPIPAGRDFTTQVLAPMLALAHNPDARSVANIGHGSGMTAASFLTSDAIERLVTIEIEPLMVEGSLVFLPANELAFTDPRLTYAFDDAKSFFSYQQERFDIIFAEPSNPWVSGTASLFTTEFYSRATDFLAEGGVLAQWMQIYELNDELFLSVLAALDEVFPSYRAYLVGDADVAIVARMDGPVGQADWNVLESEGFAALASSAPRFTSASLDALLLFDETTFRALLDSGVEANSDYRPVLDMGAERARFLRSYAEGAFSFAESRVDLGRILSGQELPPAPYSMVPAYGLVSAVLSGRGAWLRQAISEGGGIAPEEFPEWIEELLHLQSFLEQSGGDEAPPSWEAWAVGFGRAEAALHWGTTGWLDPAFYGVVERFLERTEASPEARAAVALTKSFSLGQWEPTARAADRLVFRVAAGERWAVPASLLDMAVVAYLRSGSPGLAANAIEALAPGTGRASDNLRLRLLTALVQEAERSAPN